MAVVLLIVLIGLFFVFKAVKASSSNKGACVQLGCSSDTKFVGSKKSDKYYQCDCRFSGNIKPENLLCFESAREAEQSNYIKVNC